VVVGWGLEGDYLLFLRHRQATSCQCLQEVEVSFNLSGSLTLWELGFLLI
jgi:hypothetical protein